MADDLALATPLVESASLLQGIEYDGKDFADLLKKEFKPQTPDAESAVD
jgi:type VI secretion system protein ImpC